jgi:hypothetical protein
MQQRFLTLNTPRPLLHLTIVLGMIVACINIAFCIFLSITPYVVPLAFVSLATMGLPFYFSSQNIQRTSQELAFYIAETYHTNVYVRFSTNTVPFEDFNQEHNDPHIRDKIATIHQFGTVGMSIVGLYALNIVIIVLCP